MSTAPRGVRRVSRALALALGIAAAAMAIGCATTQIAERDRIADELMQFDADPTLMYLRTKVEAAREGHLGGFGTSTAGGCGCQ